MFHKCTLIILFLFAATNVQANLNHSNSIWNYTPENMQTESCKKFDQFAFQQDDKKSLKTNQILVYVQDSPEDLGQLVYQNYRKQDSGDYLYGPHHSMSMMSGSKSITATFAHTLFAKKIRFESTQGIQKTLTPSTYLKDIISYQEAMGSQINLEQLELRHQALLKDNPKLNSFSLAQNQTNYELIQLKHLIKMTSGQVWDESYTSYLESSFLDLNYAAPESRKKSLEHIFSFPFSFKPGDVFKFSAGNSFILMFALDRILPQGAHQALEDVIFKPMGMNHAFFESAPEGLSFASTYAYMTPEEMLRLGVTLLNEGRWINEALKFKKQVLPELYVQSLQASDPSLQDFSFKAPSSHAKAITTQGEWRRGYWGNSDVLGKANEQNERELLHFRDFPNNNPKTFKWAGHFGQQLIVFPLDSDPKVAAHKIVFPLRPEATSSATEIVFPLDLVEAQANYKRMVLVRTGQNDGEGYWDKTDQLMYLARKCFADPENKLPAYVSRKDRLARFQPLLPQKSDEQKLEEIKYKTHLGLKSLSTGSAQRALSKKICSCVYIQKPGRSSNSAANRLEQCIDNSPSYSLRSLRNTLLKASLNDQHKVIKVYFPPLTPNLEESVTHALAPMTDSSEDMKARKQLLEFLIPKVVPFITEKLQNPHFLNSQFLTDSLLEFSKNNFTELHSIKGFTKKVMNRLSEIESHVAYARYSEDIATKTKACQIVSEKDLKTQIQDLDFFKNDRLDFNVWLKQAQKWTSQL